MLFSPFKLCLMGVISLCFLSACEQDESHAQYQRDSSNEAEIVELKLAVRSDSEGSSTFLESTLINHSSDVLVFLPWGTPLDANITQDFLSIIDLETGERLPYQGLALKRSPPDSSAFLRVASRESITQVLNLSSSYQLCAEKKYRLEFDQGLYGVNSQRIVIKVEPIVLIGSLGLDKC